MEAPGFSELVKCLPSVDTLMGNKALPSEFPCTLESISLCLVSIGELDPSSMAWKPPWVLYSFTSLTQGEFCIVRVLVRNLIHFFSRLLLQKLSDEDTQLEHGWAALPGLLMVVEDKDRLQVCSSSSSADLGWEICKF